MTAPMGITVALLSPLDDGGEVDGSAIKRLVTSAEAAGVGGDQPARLHR
jgi:hypothetical protein